jgi:hypothetical protein
MAGQHLSLTALTILLTVSGALFYGAIVLYGRWSTRPHNGRESLREQEEEQNGSKRG